MSGQFEFEWWGEIRDQKPNSNLLQWRGPYRSTELVAWQEKYAADLFVLCSQVPESFSFTLSETFLLGVPVVVPDWGAQAERVNLKSAWVLKGSKFWDGLSSLLAEINADPKKLLEKQKNALENTAQLLLSLPSQLRTWQDFFEKRVKQAQVNSELPKVEFFTELSSWEKYWVDSPKTKPQWLLLLKVYQKFLEWGWIHFLLKFFPKKLWLRLKLFFKQKVF